MVFLFHLSLDFPEIAEIRGPISMNLNATNLWGPRDPCEDASIQVHQDGLPGPRIRGLDHHGDRFCGTPRIG